MHSQRTYRKHVPYASTKPYSDPRRRPWVNVGSSLQAEAAGAQMVSRTFESFSRFRTAQVAVLDSAWEPNIPEARADLATIDHLRDPQLAEFASSTSTELELVAGRSPGARRGNVVRVTRKEGGTAEYGVRTASRARNEVQLATLVGGPTGGTWILKMPSNEYGTQATSALAHNAPALALQGELEKFGSVRSGGARVKRTGTGTAGDPYAYEITFRDSLGPLPQLVPQHSLTGGTNPGVAVVTIQHGLDESRLYPPGRRGPRTSAMARVQLPEGSAGTYELRLHASDGYQTRIVARRSFVAAGGAWREVELAYLADRGDSDWQASVVQVDRKVSEPMLVDMLGVWQHPVQWEFSNGGGSWVPALWPMNKPWGYLQFPREGNLVKVRATALRAGAIISGWTVVPWYIESPMVARAPIDRVPPWGHSDDQDLLDVWHKPIFQVWSNYFPQHMLTSSAPLAKAPDPPAPASIAGLALWLASDQVVGAEDGEPVQLWPDLSGAGRDAVQLQAADQPEYVEGEAYRGKAVVRFAGTEVLVAPDAAAFSPSGTGGLTVFAVARPSDGSPRHWVGKASNPYEWSISSSSSGYAVTLYQPNGTAHGAVEGGSFSPGFTLVTMVVDYGSSLRLYVNGALMGEQTSFSGSMSDTASPVTVGDRGDGVDPMLGDVAEVVAYSLALADGDRERVEAYLLGRWVG